jgi:AcrR family transcriptional regulator
MSANPSFYAPKQKRSLEMFERLLSATVRVLDEHGLDGALVPRIAASAHVSPASVYRRFADKDALLRAAFLHVLDMTREANRQHLSNALLRETLDETAGRLMLVLFTQYRSHPHLLRALVRFLDVDTDEEFVREAHWLMADNINGFVEVLLAHQESIRRNISKRVVQVAVLNAVSSIEAIVLEPESLWRTVLNVPDEELGRELAQGFVAYLRSAAERWPR